MNKLTALPLKILPYGVIIFALLLTGSLSYVLSLRDTTRQTEKHVLSSHTSEPKEITNTTPSPTLQPIISTTSIRTHAVTVSASPTPTKVPTALVSITQTTSNAPTPMNEQSQSVTATPLPQATKAPEPTQAANNVSVEIKSPSETSTFTITITNGMNVCDITQKAKEEGKINSLTFDDSYLAALKSRYVYELNGLTNNWTFTVNDSSPLGCSHSTPQPNDKIIWKFG